MGQENCRILGEFISANDCHLSTPGGSRKSEGPAAIASQIVFCSLIAALHEFLALAGELAKEGRLENRPVKTLMRGSRLSETHVFPDWGG